MASVGMIANPCFYYEILNTFWPWCSTISTLTYIKQRDYIKHKWNKPYRAMIPRPLIRSGKHCTYNSVTSGAVWPAVWSCWNHMSSKCIAPSLSCRTKSNLSCFNVLSCLQFSFHNRSQQLSSFRNVIKKLPQILISALSFE